MRALVVRQPWAWAIMEGLKDVENRTWTTPYRGPVAIIAGSSKASLKHGTAFLHSLGIEVPPDLPFGCLLGVVTVTGIIQPSASDSPFAEGPNCWVLADPVRLERPVPYRGQLGLFRLPTGDPRTESLGTIAASRPASRL